MVSRCCSSGVCGCTVKGLGGITVTGSGTRANPYVIHGGAGALSGFYSPMDFDAVGDGEADDTTALTDCFEAAAETGGVVIIDRPYGFSDKVKHYGGMQVWQISSPKIPTVPLTGWTEPGLIALEDTAWYQYGDGADGSGSANDNPGPIRGLVIDGAGIAGLRTGGGNGLFVMDSAQSSLFDLQVNNAPELGLNVGRSQNNNFYNLQVGGCDGSGLLLRPLVAGQQGPGHNIFFGGHLHDNYLPIEVTAWGATDFFGAHDNVFVKTLVETGRVAGQAVRCGAVIEVGDTTFDDCNFTFGAQVGGTTGNDVEEDCCILVDNPQFVAYSTRLQVRGGSLGGGINSVSDGIRIKQSGSANNISLTGTIGFANINYKVCNDGIVLGGADAIISNRAFDVEVTGGISDIRTINGATMLNLANKTWSSTYYELPDGLLNGAAIINGNVQNPIVIKKKSESFTRLSVDWNGTFRWLDPTSGATIGTLVRSSAVFGTTGRFGVINSMFRTPALIVQGASGTVNFNWEATSYPLLGITAGSVNVTSVTFNPTTSGATPTDGQELRIGISLTAGLTPGTITWPAGVFFDPSHGTPQPIAGVTYFVTLVYRTGVGWLETSRSHPTDPTATSANLNAAANTVNTTDKRAGKQIFNTTSNRPVWATGSSTTATWVFADGTTAHTPS